MRGNELLDKMELVEPAYVEAADAQPKRKKHYARWGALAACLCLAAAGVLLWNLAGGPDGGNNAAADSGITVTEDGVTIPPLDVSLSRSDGVAMDMQAFFIYQGRCYVQYDWLYGEPDMVGEHLGTAVGLIDEWTPAEGYVELAGSVSGDFYTVKGFDPSFMLCMTDMEDAVSLYICNTGITMKYGSELYEDRLRLADGYSAVEYETRQSWYYGEGEVRQLSDDAAASDFVAALNGAEFLLWSDAAEALGQDTSSVYDLEQYHLYFRMNNGMTVHLRLYEDGYVRYEGIMGVCVQLPQEEYDDLLALLGA